MKIYVVCVGNNLEKAFTSRIMAEKYLEYKFSWMNNPGCTCWDKPYIKEVELVK